MSSKHGRWLDSTLFRGRALMHSLCRKNVTAIDHMLRGGSQFNAIAIQYGKLSTQRHMK